MLLIERLRRLKDDAKPTKLARLTAYMEREGVYLTTDDNGLIHMECHAGDEKGLERWDTPAVRAFIEKRREEFWVWLRTPLQHLSESDIESLMGPMGKELAR